MTKLFKQKLQLLCDAFFYAKEHFDIWQGLENCCEKHKDLYRDYSDFLEPSRKAHFGSMLMAVCSVFDKAGLGIYYFDNKKQQHRYGRFIEEIEKHSIIEKEKIQKIKTTLQQKSSLIKKARTLRDKHFAHAELKIEDALNEAKLTTSDCKALVEIAVESVNEICRACGDGSFDSDPNGGYTLSRLLDALAIQKNKVDSTV